MTDDKRFILTLEDEVYCITDTNTLSRTLDYYIEEFNDPSYEMTEEEIQENAKQEYVDYLYENSMSGTEVENTLNQLHQDKIFWKEKAFACNKYKIFIADTFQKYYDKIKEKYTRTASEDFKELADELGVELK